jgi:hypothetical protein
LRFAARFGFEIESPTWDAIMRSAPHLQRLSAERVRQEIEKTMEQVVAPASAFRMWRDSGAFAGLIPALAGISDVDLAVMDHLSLPLPKAKPGRRSNRITALFLTTGPAGASREFRKLRFSNSAIAWMSAVVERWYADVPDLERAMASGHLPDAAFVRHWVARVGRMRAASVVRLAIAAWCARSDAGLPAPASSLYRPLFGRIQRAAFRDPVEIGDLQIDGDDLRAIGVASGPIVGRMLRRLLDRVLENPALNERALLLQIADEIARDGSDAGKPGGPSAR